MALKDLQPRQGKVDIVVEVAQKSEPRSWTKFGNSGKVANAKVRDESGEMTLTLWNDDADKVNVGDKIHIINGYVGEWQGEMQLSTGKFGSMEIVEKGKGQVSTPAPKVSEPKQATVLKKDEKPNIAKEEMLYDESSDDLEVEEENMDDLYDEEEM